MIQWNRKWQLEVFFFSFFGYFFIHEDIKKKRVVEIPIMALKEIESLTIGYVYMNSPNCPCSKFS